MVKICIEKIKINFVRNYYFLFVYTRFSIFIFRCNENHIFEFVPNKTMVYFFNEQNTF